MSVLGVHRQYLVPAACVENKVVDNSTAVCQCGVDHCTVGKKCVKGRCSLALGKLSMTEVKFLSLIFLLARVKTRVVTITLIPMLGKSLYI